MADEPVLTTGDTGEWVSYLQQLLEYHQFGSGFTAGTFDDTTATALSAAQQYYSLPVTGSTDEATWSALRGEQSGQGGTGQGNAGDGSGETDSAEQIPDDIAVSLSDEVNADDVDDTFSELEDLPSNVVA